MNAQTISPTFPVIAYHHETEETFYLYNLTDLLEYLNDCDEFHTFTATEA